MSARVVYGLATWPYPKSGICMYVFTPMLSVFVGQDMVLFPSVLGCDVERGAQVSVYMGRGCHPVTCVVLLAPACTTNQRKFRQFH